MVVHSEAGLRCALGDVGCTVGMYHILMYSRFVPYTVQGYPQRKRLKFFRFNNLKVKFAFLHDCSSYMAILKI